MLIVISRFQNKSDDAVAIINVKHTNNL